MTPGDPAAVVQPPPPTIHEATRATDAEEAAMKYFTPQLYERLQNFDPAAMAAADAEWEAASQRYEQHLEQLGAALVPVLKNFEGILLHDAAVLGISRRGDQFSIVL